MNKKERKKLWSNIKLGATIFIVFVAVIMLTNMYEDFYQDAPKATITGVKDVSKGGFLSSDICLYETDKGDYTSSDCFHRVGDEIIMGFD